MLPNLAPKAYNAAPRPLAPMAYQDLRADSEDFAAEKAQAHLTLLRFFCAILDAANAGDLRNILKAAEARYGMYLELLLRMENLPNERLPLPPWLVFLCGSLTIQGCRPNSACSYAFPITLQPRYFHLV